MKPKSLGSAGDAGSTLYSLLMMEEGEYALGLKTTCQEAGEHWKGQQQCEILLS